MPNQGRPSGAYERVDWERGQNYRFEEVDTDQEEIWRAEARRAALSGKPELYASLSGGLHRSYSQESSEEYRGRGRGSGSSSDEHGYDRTSTAQQIMFRPDNDDDYLIRKAEERIDKAKARGKQRVSLSHEELEALERRRARTAAQIRRKPSPIPAKRSPSLGGGAWTRRRSSSKGGGGMLSAVTSAPRQRSSVRSSRPRDSPPSREESFTRTGGGEPGIYLGNGPNGEPIYSPLGFYATQTGRRGDTNRPSPPIPDPRISARYGGNYISNGQYDSRDYHLSRHSSNASNYRNRPSNNSSRGSPMPDEGDYGYRTMSGPPYTAEVYNHSTSQPSDYPYSLQVGSAPLPSGRRVVSGPEVAYSSVRRRPLSANLDALPHDISDPALVYQNSGPSTAQYINEPSDEDSSDAREDPEPEPEPQRIPARTSTRVTRSDTRRSSGIKAPEDKTVRRKRRT